MTPEEMERRFKAAITELSLTPDQATALSQQLVATEKAAQSQGIAFKSTDAQPVYTAPDGTQGIIQDGMFVALKAAPPPEPATDEVMAVEETKADPMLDEVVTDEMAEPEDEMDANVLGNMTPDEFFAMLDERLAPVLKLQDMLKSMGDIHGELKSMYSGATTKDDARAKELATLKEQQIALANRIAQIEGQQPATILPGDVAAALKSAGPTVPADANPTKPQIPNDPSRPMAAATAAIIPELYYDGANGWQQRPAN